VAHRQAWLPASRCCCVRPVCRPHAVEVCAEAGATAAGVGLQPPMRLTRCVAVTYGTQRPWPGRGDTKVRSHALAAQGPRMTQTPPIEALQHHTWACVSARSTSEWMDGVSEPALAISRTRTPETMKNLVAKAHTGRLGEVTGKTPALEGGTKSVPAKGNPKQHASCLAAGAAFPPSRPDGAHTRQRRRLQQLVAHVPPQKEESPTQAGIPQCA
jgi:hypothetical protein